MSATRPAVVTARRADLFGETRAERIKEFHEMNDTPVIGLWEAGILEVAAGEVKLMAAPTKVFRKGKEPVTVAPGTELPGLSW